MFLGPLFVGTQCSIRPAEDVFEEYRSLTLVVVGLDVEPYHNDYKNAASNTAPEDYLTVPETETVGNNGPVGYTTLIVKA